MSDGTDGKQGIEGTEGDANSNSSNQGNGLQGSNTATDALEQIRKLQEQVDTLSRSLQSNKDKGIAKTNQRIDSLERDLKSVLQNALQKGQSVQDVLGEIEQDEEREARQTILEIARTLKEGKLPTNSGGTEPTGVDVTKVLRELELDEADTRVQVLRSQRFNSEADAYREAAKVLKTINSKQPSDADAPSGIAKVRGNPDEQTRLMQEYQNGSAKLRGQALINYKMEMRRKGLRIS